MSNRDNLGRAEFKEGDALRAMPNYTIKHKSVTPGSVFLVLESKVTGSITQLQLLAPDGSVISEPAYKFHRT